MMFLAEAVDYAEYYGGMSNGRVISVRAVTGPLAGTPSRRTWQVMCVALVCATHMMTPKCGDCDCSCSDTRFMTISGILRLVECRGILSDLAVVGFGEP